MKTYSINYAKVFASNGVVYNQTITIKTDDFGIELYNICMKALGSKKTLKEGVNYTTLTESRYIAKILNLYHDKRYKRDRNTIVKLLVK